MSDFIISVNLFGEYDNFEDWDAAEKEEATQGGDTGGIEQIRGRQGRDKNKENQDMGR